jgi:hypothetical protein
MAWRWWLRHRRPPASDPRTALVFAVGRDGALTEAEQTAYDREATVLGDTVRASSAVECMNSVQWMPPKCGWRAPGAASPGASPFRPSDAAAPRFLPGEEADGQQGQQESQHGQGQQAEVPSIGERHGHGA